MPYKPDIELDLKPKIPNIYIAVSSHRKKGNPHKSIWTISIAQEVGCFIECQLQKWTEVPIAWGVIRKGEELIKLGENDDNDNLKIAKFIDSAKKDIWHGYPADYAKKNQDRPGMNVLTKWRAAGIIKKHQITKIRRGVECNL